MIFLAPENLDNPVDKSPKDQQQLNQLVVFIKNKFT